MMRGCPAVPQRHPIIAQGTPLCRPKGMQAFLEPLILFVRDDIIKSNIGPKYKKYTMFLLTVFFFILINNLLEYGIETYKIDIEPYIEVGDMSVYCPTVEHGVKSIDIQLKGKSYNWNSGIGRWWMGLFCPDSNEINKRNTSISLETFHSKKV